MPPSIRFAESLKDVRACYDVMHQLRPALSAEQFVERVRQQQKQGYHLVRADVEDVVVAVAGVRFGDNLAWGHHFYVDDLVTDEARRSEGHGQLLFDWLVDYATRAGCGQFHLDSGIQRHDAHRFYLRNKMRISSHHFALDLPLPPRVSYSDLAAEPRCVGCGYDMRGHRGQSVCPECGERFAG